MNGIASRLAQVVNELQQKVLLTAILLYSWAELTFLDLQDILFYPLFNRQPDGDRFPPVHDKTIFAGLSNSDVEDLTGLSHYSLDDFSLVGEWKIDI